MQEGPSHSASPQVPGRDVAAPPLRRIGAFVVELRRRRVFRALIGWGVVSFAVLQVIEPVMHGLDLPDWTLKTAIWLLAAGFPVTIALAWVFDLGPGGISRTADVPGGEIGEGSAGRRFAPLFAGLVALGALLGAGVAFVALRHAGPAPGPDGRIVVAVADITNETGERELDVLSGLLVTSLEQSRNLSVMTQARVLDLAVRAGRKDVSRVDETIGRAVGKAHAVRALLLPAIRRLGTTYSLEMRAIDPVRDRHLFTLSDRATSKDALLDLLDKLSERTRNELGEGKDDVGRTSIQLAQAMTRSVEAYQHYVAGLEAWHREGLRAVGLREFQEALRLDPDFTAAHGELADLLHHSYEMPAAAAPHWKAANDGLDRMPEKERLLFRLKRSHRDPGMEHFSRKDAVRLADEVLARFPDDKLAITSAADAFESFDLPERWEPALRRALQLDPGYFWAAATLADWLGARTSDALEVARKAVATRRNAANVSILARTLWATGDDDGALAAAREVLHVDGGRNSLLAARACDVFYEKGIGAECLPVWRRMVAEGANEYERDFARLRLLKVLIQQGRIREVLRFTQATPGFTTAVSPWWLLTIHQVGRARTNSPKALEAARLIPNPQFRRNALSWLGATEEAERITSSIEGKGLEIVEKVNRAILLVNRGRPAEAAAIVAGVRDEAHRRNYPGSVFGLAFLHAEALFAAGHPAEAAEIWPATLPCRCTDPLDHATQYPRLALVRARAMEQLGRGADAIRELDGVIVFWKEADQDLPLLIEAKAMRARLAKACVQRR